MVMIQNHTNSILFENVLPPKALTDTVHRIYYYNRVGPMLPTLRAHEYNHSTQQEIPQSYRQVLNITQISNICSKYFQLTRQLNYKKSLRRLCLAQGFYNLISHLGSFRQILTELIIRTASLGSLSKSIQTSGWPIRFHQPKHVTYCNTLI